MVPRAPRTPTEILGSTLFSNVPRTNCGASVVDETSHCSVADRAYSSRVAADGDSENIFVMDEDSRAAELSGLEVRHFTNDFEIESDDGVVDDIPGSSVEERPGKALSYAQQSSAVDSNGTVYSQLQQQEREEERYPHPRRQRHTRGPLGRQPIIAETAGSMPASLPIDIDLNCALWRPALEEQLYGAESDEGAWARDARGKKRLRTSSTYMPYQRMMGQNIDTGENHQNMYRNIQAYSRSIVTSDDPEHLFGQRPSRHANRCQKESGPSDPPPPGDEEEGHLFTEPPIQKELASQTSVSGFSTDPLAGTTSGIRSLSIRNLEKETAFVEDKGEEQPEEMEAVAPMDIVSGCKTPLDQGPKVIVPRSFSSRKW